MFWYPIVELSTKEDLAKQAEMKLGKLQREEMSAVAAAIGTVFLGT